jgi:hypothetical protein
VEHHRDDQNQLRVQRKPPHAPVEVRHDGKAQPADENQDREGHHDKRIAGSFVL